jgi:two-component system response regulator AtoC
MQHVLVVDDERDAAESMAMLISAAGFTVSTAGTLRDARRQIAMREPDLVLLDLRLPDGSGMTLFDDAVLRSRTEVVFVTGHGDVETSVQALRLGAADYLLKPVAAKQLMDILGRVSRAAVRRIDSPTKGALGRSGKLLGHAPVMRRMRNQIDRVAPTDVTVLLTGESGSGKELVAATVHEQSRRRERPMLAVNCGAISPHLMESELFGHEKGSFTGADAQHIGFFESARGGTLFLDEITEMPLELQVKLLRVLETGSFLRVGSTQMQTTDLRLIAATNRDPMRAVAEGKLREDLLYRLNVFPLHVPPLRDRAEDIALIAAYFLELISQREQLVKRFAPSALAALSEHDWPGNVRELRNVVERAYVMAAGAEIVDPCLTVAEAAAPACNDPAGVPTLQVCVGDSWSDIERQVMLATLEHFDGHQQRASQALGISVKTLYNRLRDWSLLPHTGLVRSRQPARSAPPLGPVRSGLSAD